jgi:hypothetical protein
MMPIVLVTVSKDLDGALESRIESNMGSLKVALSDRGTSSATLTLVENEWIGTGIRNLAYNNNKI